jgi:hypothetical protein
LSKKKELKTRKDPPALRGDLLPPRGNAKNPKSPKTMEHNATKGEFTPYIVVKQAGFGAS